MNEHEIFVGQKVIPVNSTFQDSLWQYHNPVIWEDFTKRINSYMPKGYLIVCSKEIHNDRQVIFCCSDGRKQSWGHTNTWYWLPFYPEDLIPLTKNTVYFLKYKNARGR